MKKVFSFLLSQLNSKDQIVSAMAQNTLDIAVDVSHTCEETAFALKEAVEEHIDMRFKESPKDWVLLKAKVTEINAFNEKFSANISNN
jgi:hypothetical protein